MPRTVTLFTVWVSSPGDTQDERECLSRVIADLNAAVASKLDLILQLRSWDTLLPLISTSGPQDAINASVRADDIFVGILWNRVGTPMPPPFESLTGTEYEFKLALDSYRRTGMPHVLIYGGRKPIDVSSVDHIGALEQLRRVSEFKKSLRTEVFFREFGDKDEFARQVHQDIARFLAEWASSRRTETSRDASVFISYAREDSEFIASLARELAVSGIRSWYDTSQLAGGEDWVMRIADAIEGAHVFLLVASESTLTSPWVRREVEFADRKSKSIIPVQIDDVQWPTWFELQFGRLQRLRLERDRNQLNVQELIDAIRSAHRV